MSTNYRLFPPLLGLTDFSKTQLPNPEIIIATAEKLLKAFGNVIQMELIRVRWEEIKKFNTQYLKV